MPTAIAPTTMYSATTRPPYSLSAARTYSRHKPRNTNAMP